MRFALRSPAAAHRLYCDVKENIPHGKNKKTIRALWPDAAGWALFLALLGGLLLALLWGALEKYELSTPEHAILTLLETARTGSDEALAQAAGYTPQGAATLESWAGAARDALAEIPRTGTGWPL